MITGPVRELLQLHLRDSARKASLYLFAKVSAKAPISFGAFAGELEPIVVGTWQHVMTLSTGISPQLYLLVAALAEDLNGIKRAKRACKNEEAALRHRALSTSGLISSLSQAFYLFQRGDSPDCNNPASGYATARKGGPPPCVGHPPHTRQPPNLQPAITRWRPYLKGLQPVSIVTLWRGGRIGRRWHRRQTSCRSN
jgi:hypothetical protein